MLTNWNWKCCFKTNSRREDDVYAFHIQTLRHFFFAESLVACEALDYERPEKRSRECSLSQLIQDINNHEKA